MQCHVINIAQTLSKLANHYDETVILKFILMQPLCFLCFPWWRNADSVYDSYNSSRPLSYLNEYDKFGEDIYSALEQICSCVSSILLSAVLIGDISLVESKSIENCSLGLDYPDKHCFLKEKCSALISTNKHLFIGMAAEISDISKPQETKPKLSAWVDTARCQWHSCTIWQSL